MSELACSVCGKGTENMRLLKRLNRVELERDKLRYVCDELTRDAISLQAENNKLRKLSSTMLKCIKAKERRALICWECPMHKQFDELRSYCCLEHEAKELGIEVPE